MKTIVTDLDGTLLNSDRKLSDVNSEALRECVKKGIDIWVATARPYRLVFSEKGVLKNLTFLEEKGVFYNGAYVYNKTTGYEKHYLISSKLTNKTISQIENYDPTLRIAIQNGESYHSYTHPDSETIEGWGFPLEECIAFEEAKNLPSSKIVVWDEGRNLSGLYGALIRSLSDSLNIYITNRNHWIQIMSRDATKESALMDMFKQHGVKPEDVVAFGDDLPDLGMIRIFGCSLAVGNAMQGIREAATYTTLNNDQHGVSYALREILELI
jgi:Cof subfamily protein (haloacid dehalogenase superfamily)